MDNSAKEPESNKDTQKMVGIMMLEAAFEFAVLIAGPLLLGVFAGKWLDAKTNHNFFVIIGILLGIAISCVAIGIRINDYKKLLQRKTKK
jgi:F0F1-type ATP synthase assembly protein I